MKIICPDGNGYSYYVQAVDETRYSRANGVETFLVKAGDYWNGPDGSDALNYRERCEARVTTEDAVGSTWRYAFHLKIPRTIPNSARSRRSASGTTVSTTASSTATRRASSRSASTTRRPAFSRRHRSR